MMKRQTGLARVMVASFGVVALVALGGCQRGNPQAQATSTPANLAMTTPAATAALPPGGQPMTGAAGNSQLQGAPQQGSAAAEPQFAQVVAVRAVTQPVTTNKPRQVCEDQLVQVPKDYKDDHQIAGAAVGGVVGGLLGNQIGGGNGKKLATVAGLAAGAYAGHEIQKNHQEKNATKTVTRNVCRTVTDKSTSTKTVGYDVTYKLNGQTGHVRMDSKPAIGTGLPVRNGTVVAGGQQAGNYYQ